MLFSQCAYLHFLCTLLLGLNWQYNWIIRVSDGSQHFLQKNYIKQYWISNSRNYISSNCKKLLLLFYNSMSIGSHASNQLYWTCVSNTKLQNDPRCLIFMCQWNEFFCIDPSQMRTCRLVLYRTLTMETRITFQATGVSIKSLIDFSGHCIIS